MDSTTGTSHGNYVLAMYDVRGKQNFIYRSTHIKEIIGGSDIIRTVFKRELYSAAKDYRNEKLYNAGSDYKTDSDKLKAEAVYDYHKQDAKLIGGNNDENEPTSMERFSYKAFENRMNSSGSQYIGEVVYDGGGNFVILYQDAETCKEVTYRFTKKVIENYTSLKVICTYVDNLNPEKYHGTPDNPGDYERLYRKHRYVENEQIVTMPYGTLPVVQADYLTSMPLTHFMKRTPLEKGFSKLSTESAAKYARYREIQANKKSQKSLFLPDERTLDRMITKKGEESLLAVIYMDGNNMGASVERCLEGAYSYDECVNRLRVFSEQIQKAFIDDQASAFRAGSNDRMRLVIGAGDEVTVICNARDAYSVALNYLINLKNIEGNDTSPGYRFTSCAGIAIFHSHAPYSEAYRIAEECCESGKKYIRAHPNIPQDVCMIDYHYCQGAIGTSLSKIREEENTLDCSRPWLIVNKDTVACLENSYQNDLDKEADLKSDSGPYTHEQVMEMVKLLNVFGRNNLKGLNIASQKGNSVFELEVRRIEAHLSVFQKKLLEAGKCDIQKQIYDNISSARTLIEDIVIVYDLWNETWKEEIGWNQIVAIAEGNAKAPEAEGKGNNSFTPFFIKSDHEDSVQQEESE